jgi:hypothetical protein
MKISELIDRLQNAQILYGDLRVLTDNIRIDHIERVESFGNEMCLNLASTEPWRTF